jgi:hypothetical protein
MSTISPSSITANLQQTSTINRQNNDVLSKTNKIKINENNSQIPFEIYEAAYEEEPEEDRNKLNFNNNKKIKISYLVAPIDGTIISHLISQVRSIIYISILIFIFILGSYINGFN